MTQDKTGGAAFPHVSPHLDRTGMTLRDYFAGQVVTQFHQYWPDEAAARAYRFADAMIAERKKGAGDG